VTDKDLEFYDKVSPVFSGKKYSIPSPSLCPDERMRNTMCFRNQSSLHKIEEGLHKTNIISIYHPSSPYTVYNQGDWWTDAWDPKKYNANFVNSQSFFDIFFDLKKKVPRPHAIIKNSEICEYTNYMLDGKDNYLAFASSWSEKALYVAWTTHSNTVIDCTACDNIRHSYQLVGCGNCESSGYCVNSENSSSIWFSYGLKNCQNCLFCTNLQGKEFYVFNKYVGKEVFISLSADAKRHLTDSLFQYSKILKHTSFRRETENINCENVSGEYLKNCKNCW